MRICCWSGPRNISTALMYSFAQRDDTTAVDEPLYAHYLRVTGREHPRREQVLAAQDPDGEAVVRHVVLGPVDTPIVFFKMMAHHLVELDMITVTGGRPLVIDSDRLLDDPEAMLRAVCDQIDIAFDPAMLSWPAGPKPEDGVWARHWYHRVHESTGFSRRSSEHPPLSPRLTAVLDQARPLSERLLAYGAQRT